MPNEPPPPQRFLTPQAINDAIQDQEEAVASRELIHQPTSTITLFAFDTQQSLSEHTAPYDALVLVIDGRAEMRVAGLPMRSKPKICYYSLPTARTLSRPWNHSKWS